MAPPRLGRYASAATRLKTLALNNSSNRLRRLSDALRILAQITLKREFDEYEQPDFNQTVAVVMDHGRVLAPPAIQMGMAHAYNLLNQRPPQYAAAAHEFLLLADTLNWVYAT